MRDVDLPPAQPARLSGDDVEHTDIRLVVGTGDGHVGPAAERIRHGHVSGLLSVLDDEVPPEKVRNFCRLAGEVENEPDAVGQDRSSGAEGLDLALMDDKSAEGVFLPEAWEGAVGPASEKSRRGPGHG